MGVALAPRGPNLCMLAGLGVWTLLPLISHPSSLVHADGPLPNGSGIDFRFSVSTDISTATVKERLSA